GRTDPHPPPRAFVVDPHDLPDGVDVALDEMPFERVAGAEGDLDVDAPAGSHLAQRRSAACLLRDGGEEAFSVDRLGRDAGSVDADRAAGVDLPTRLGRVDVEVIGR